MHDRAKMRDDVRSMGLECPSIQLADELERIQNPFRVAYGAQSNPEFAMEVEFKITSDGILIFKQARPWID